MENRQPNIILYLRKKNTPHSEADWVGFDQTTGEVSCGPSHDKRNLSHQLNLGLYIKFGEKHPYIFVDSGTLVYLVEKGKKRPPLSKRDMEEFRQGLARSPDMQAKLVDEFTVAVDGIQGILNNAKQTEKYTNDHVRRPLGIPKSGLGEISNIDPTEIPIPSSWLQEEEETNVVTSGTLKGIHILHFQPEQTETTTKAKKLTFCS